ALVTEDVRELLADTRFATAEIIPTSVVSGAGLERLRQAIADLAQTANPRPQTDLFRLPVDRSFTVKGTGTVVTGTVWSGSLSLDQTVRIMPYGASARARGLQNHGHTVDRITPGMRAAVALAGVDTGAVGRGATLVTLPGWEATLIVRADLTLLDNAPELRPRTKVQLHLATADVGARVVAAGSPVAPGSSRTVRIALDEPIMARAGDRFVLRSASPLATIGGGVITDSNAPRRAKPMSSLNLGTRERLHLFVSESGIRGLAESSLAVRLGVSASEAAVMAQDAAVVRVGSRLYAAPVVAEAGGRVLELVRAHHEQRPLDSGAPRQDIRSRLGVDVALFDRLVAALAKDGRLEATGAELRLPGRAPALSDQQRKLGDELSAAIEGAGHEPPSVGELETRFGPQTPALLRHLERERRVVQVENNRYYAPAVVQELLHRLEGGMAGRGEVAPAELRDVLGFSRKFLIPFLEYCDRAGSTRRQGTGRIWRGK
ncbi:MAG TPA: SelB C-terminal domain-containing protein, partial [Gemmatimonadaceae bacterium]|nr:SelB C-terminal domain-containing protein [Gemmatimonadaceae bacterium]